MGWTDVRALRIAAAYVLGGTMSRVQQESAALFAGRKAGIDTLPKPKTGGSAGWGRSFHRESESPT